MDVRERIHMCVEIHLLSNLLNMRHIFYLRKCLILDKKYKFAKHKAVFFLRTQLVDLKGHNYKKSVDSSIFTYTCKSLTRILCLITMISAILTFTCHITLTPKFTTLMLMLFHCDINSQLLPTLTIVYLIMVDQLLFHESLI